MLDKHRIFAHRGIWGNGVEGNSADALLAALELGFSVETDIRDNKGRIVIAHDPVLPKSEPLDLDSLLAQRGSESGVIALNVKADGLIGIGAQGHEGVFFFDMSAPEALRYVSSGLEIALRLSDREPAMTPKGLSPEWLWVDCFDGDWFTQFDFSEFEDFKGVIIVSPELHGRDSSRAWSFIAENWNKIPNLCICTDRPLEMLQAVQ